MKIIRIKQTLWIVLAGSLALPGAGLSGVSEAAPQRATHTPDVVELDDPRIVAVERAQTPAHTRVTILRLDAEQIRQTHTLGAKVRIRHFPLDETESVELELKPFRVTGNNSRFVIGRLDGPDIPFPYDASRISFFHGRVIDQPGSHVYLSISDHSSTGYIDLGPGRPRYRIASNGVNGRPLSANRISVFQATGAPSAPGGVPLCGVEGNQLQYRGEWIDSPTAPRVVAEATSAAVKVGLKHMELAVETDYEYYTLFNDATAASDYIVQMYGEVSAIYMRDVDMRIEVVYVRIWDNANDLFNGPEPLFQFYPYWIANMGAVPRDAAQFFSGRRDFPFGGQAFLTQLCGTFHYGIVGYVVGSFPDPTKPHPFNWDVPVTAHELGHTSGTGHTHSNGIDTCDNANTTPQRGPIMSYCGQTWSGMKANTDNYFHAISQASMDAHIAASACVVADCNMNNVADSVDIAGASSDLNGNGVPDECEDCNNNGTLDPADIAAGASDLNGNGVPDECEPDCNGNGVPDDRDILLGTSLDAYGNDIPDDCETDCNTNGTSDYTEIQADMTLDKDRNAALDACQDCDSDGTSDLVELSDAHHLWVTTGLANEVVRQFLGSTGVLTDTSSSTVNEGQDLIVRSGGDILVTSAVDDRVMRFDASGNFMGDFVTSGSGGLNYPTGLIMAPSGMLLVSSRDTHSVLSYNGTSGASMGAFVAAGLGGLVRPFGLTYGLNGNLFVTSDSNEVMEYDGATGAFVKVFIPASNNGGLDQPRGLAFKPDGHLLVASYGTDEVLEYERSTGTPRGKWAHVGTATRITQDSPWGIRVGPNGNVYVSRTGTAFSSSPSTQDVAASHLTDARMFEYDVCTGDFRKTQIGGNDHGLEFATGFDFVPGFTIDCNVNELPDNCDIGPGASLDNDSNGVPDECQVDCNNNGTYDRLDIYPYGASLDCNCNFVPDECDLAGGSSDCNGNGILDECEIDFDCNDNGTQDICEIADGSAGDCNDNNIIDACEAVSDGVLLDEDFEGGLPVGWAATGIFSVTGACPGGGACDGTSWAYAGDTAFCSYGNGQHGGLVSPLIDLPPGTAELRYCSALSTEADFDFADVVVNNVRLERLSGGTGVWETRVVDLSEFAGETVQIIFRLESDPSVSGTLGWLVDNVQVISGYMSEDCNANGVPDDCESDCQPNGVPDECDIADGTSLDLDGNGVPDECCCESGAPEPILIPDSVSGNPLKVLTTNRMLIFTAGDDCPSGGMQAIRVTYTDLAPPFDIWNGEQLWVGEPKLVTENGSQVAPLEGFADSVFAKLQCTPYCRDDWASLGDLHVFQEGVGHGSVFDIQVVDCTCIDQEGAYSPSLTLNTSKFADIVRDCTKSPCPPPEGGLITVLDFQAVVNKFTSAPGSVRKGRADLEPNCLDLVINVVDWLQAVSGFNGLSYRFLPKATVPCPKTCMSPISSLPSIP